MDSLKKEKLKLNMAYLLYFHKKTLHNVKNIKKIKDVKI